MLHSTRPLLTLMASILAMLAITACQTDDIDTEYDFEQPANHTVLMYLVGDYSNMSSPLENNIKAAQNAIRDSISAQKINLLVFKDNQQPNDNLPVLYWVHGTIKHELDTVMIKRWNSEIDATDPSVISEVINLAFKNFDTPIKGLIVGSHASGWVPRMNNAVRSPRRDSFGLDVDTPDQKSHTCELVEFGDALLRCPKLDYMIMDCCFMGNAEVAYQMRNITHYLVASPTEVMGTGMPYSNVLTRLAKCNSVAGLPDALDYGMHCYFDNHKRTNGATIALYDLTYMEQLASQYRTLILANNDRLKEIANTDKNTLYQWLEEFQPYVRYKFYFYDLQDMADWLGATQSNGAKAVKDALQQVVIKEYHANHFLEIEINRSCGIGVTIPEVFSLANDGYFSSYFNNLSYSELMASYGATDWGRTMGY